MLTKFRAFGNLYARAAFLLLPANFVAMRFPAVPNENKKFNSDNIYARFIGFLRAYESL